MHTFNEYEVEYELKNVRCWCREQSKPAKCVEARLFSFLSILDEKEKRCSFDAQNIC